MHTRQRLLKIRPPSEPNRKFRKPFSIPDTSNRFLEQFPFEEHPFPSPKQPESIPPLYTRQKQKDRPIVRLFSFSILLLSQIIVGGNRESRERERERERKGEGEKELDAVHNTRDGGEELLINCLAEHVTSPVWTALSFIMRYHCRVRNSSRASRQASWPEPGA